MDNICFSEMRY